LRKVRVQTKRPPHLPTLSRRGKASGSQGVRTTRTWSAHLLALTRYGQGLGSRRVQAKQMARTVAHPKQTRQGKDWARGGRGPKRWPAHVLTIGRQRQPNHSPHISPRSANIKKRSGPPGVAGQQK